MSMNSSSHHHHHAHEPHVNAQRLPWFFSFCNQRTSNNGSNSFRLRRSNNNTTSRTIAAAVAAYNTSKNTRPSNVFGLDLIEHTRRFSQDDFVPHIVKSCTQFIEKHGIIFGIYRLSGMRVNIHKLRQDFDNDPKIDMIDNEAISNDAHAVACVLKQYFRELPTPLLTFHMYDKFINLFKHDSNINKNFTTSVSDSQLLSLSSMVPTLPDGSSRHQEKLETLKQLLKQLPKAHYQTLKYLMKHLAWIAANGQKTGMNSKNVAIVWAPNLLKPRELQLTAALETLQTVGLQAVVTEQLIKHHDFLFDETCK